MTSYRIRVPSLFLKKTLSCRNGSNRLLALGLFCVLSCAGLQAQITGGLRGTVSDASGGALPKATITLTSVDSSNVRTQTANSNGEFSFDLLNTGNYRIKAEASGFAAGQTQAEVKTGEIASINFKLDIGTVTQVVEVSTAVARIDTENSQ